MKDCVRSRAHHIFFPAATGIPDPQDSHAVIMSKFAQVCLFRFARLVKKLETKLGPGTASLAMKVGLHSGPVTVSRCRGNFSLIRGFSASASFQFTGWSASREESTIPVVW